MTLTDYEKDYLFDLRGYLILDDALSADQLQRMNAWIDEHPALDKDLGEWVGNVELHTYSGNEGVNYQNIIEGGTVFEELIDHPSWIEDARRWIQNDYNKLSINECFLNVRRSGGFIGLHSGGHCPAAPLSFTHHTGRWNVGQINILMALTDIGPGDGATVIVPGSHKSTMPHPDLTESKFETFRSDKHAGDAIAAQEVHLKAGQAVLFTDAISHGATARINDGERRVCIYRYSPHSMIPRYNYLPSPALLERLTPERRKIIEAFPAPKYSPGHTIEAV